MTINDKAEEIARSYDGLSGDPSHPRFDEYLAVIAPGETRERAVEMSKMSGCALVAAAVWRACGIDHPLLNAPYKDMTAVSRLYEIARQTGAIVQPEEGMAPLAGSVVLLTGPEHVYVVLCDRNSPRIALDGGQKDGKGFQCVQIKEHFITAGSEKSRVAPDGPFGRTRKEVCWFDLGAIEAFCIYR